MAAFVVVAPAAGSPRPGLQLDIFPGAATPSVFPAGAPFWIGYGFVPDGEDAATGLRGLADGTRFELDVDLEPAAVRREPSERDPAGRVEVAIFPVGLPLGWHRFAGRWYDGERLVLTCNTSVEFVEPQQ